MKLAVEIYTEKPLFVKEDSWFKLSLRTQGLVFEDTKGCDLYNLGSLILSGKRLGGAARSVVYDKMIYPAGFGTGEARPGAYMQVDESSCHGAAIILETNLILDLGLLRDSVGIRLVNEDGKAFDIPLMRPDIEIAWNGRGRFVIPIGEFLDSKIFTFKMKRAT